MFIVDKAINAAPAVPADRIRKGVRVMKSTFKKIITAMDEYYKINNIEVDPFDDETQDKAIEYTAKKLGMTFRQVCEYLD